jgi:hypothetical protein
LPQSRTQCTVTQTSAQRLKESGGVCRRGEGASITHRAMPEAQPSPVQTWKIYPVRGLSLSQKQFSDRGWCVERGATGRLWLPRTAQTREPCPRPALVEYWSNTGQTPGRCAGSDAVGLGPQPSRPWSYSGHIVTSRGRPLHSSAFTDSRQAQPGPSTSWEGGQRKVECSEARGAERRVGKGVIGGWPDSGK